MSRRSGNNAVRRIFFVTLAAMLIIATDVFVVAIAKTHMRSGTDLGDYVNSANTVTETTKALRGNIYDRYGTVIAQDNRTYNIVCVLDENRKAMEGQIAYVKDKENTAEILSGILHMDYQKILDFLNQKNIWQTELGENGRKLSKAVKDEIDSYNLPGIEFTDSIQRVYPLGTFASNLIGYAQSDENGSTIGKMGLELYLDNYLMGADGKRMYQVDKEGYVLPGMRETVISAQNGNNVYLTLDSGIQTALEQSFQISEARFNVESAWGAAMEIKTGKVIAWGQYPSFDPNKLDIEEYNNIGAQLPYEPGSTLKTFTWAAAINEGKYDGDATTDGNIFCFTSDSHNDPVRTYGEGYGCKYNARRKQYGDVSYDIGLMKSLNTVAAALQTEVITPEIHLDYLKKFGFWQPVDTDGIPEETGYLNFTWPADKLSLSYGQGSTVNMLQMLQAYSAIFSDGTMVKPYFVESVRDAYDNSKVIYQAETKTVGNPITPQTAKQVQDILYRTVNDPEGTATYYQIPECRLMGKTGTTEIAIAGTYSDKTITSFMCAMPAEDPQVIAYYCFRAEYDLNAHVETDAMKNFCRKIAMTYGFTGNSGKQNTDAVEPQEGEEEPLVEIKKYDMPNLINHSMDYAQNKLACKDVDIIVLGDGRSVIDQYPRPEGKVMTNQRVFLLTDASSFTMPDLTGWTRKDVAALWAVTGFGFQLQGEGKVVSQNIPPGTIVSKGTGIKVVFEQGQGVKDDG